METNTSFREFKLRDTIRKVLPLQNRLGITRIADITELDTLGIPVITAIRANTSDKQITTCQGKGTTYYEAIASALMEAVERHAAAIPHKTIISKRSELLRRNVPIFDVNLPESCDQELEWVTGKRLTDGVKVLIPAAEVLFPYEPAEGCIRHLRPSTTGLASGNTNEEAILHGLFEVIERHAVSCFVEKANCPMLNLSTISDKRILAILARFQSNGVDLAVVDLSDVLGVATYKVYCVDDKLRQASLSVSGQGTHLNPQIALKRALTEAAQARVVAIQGSREDLSRHAHQWHRSYAEAREAFEYVRICSARNGLVPMQARAELNNTAEGSIVQVLRLLRLKGHDCVAVTDLTVASINIPVVHVSVSGLLDSVVQQ